jgi:hypothetical protein
MKLQVCYWAELLSADIIYMKAWRIWSTGEMMLMGNTVVLEQNLSQCHFAHHKFHKDWSEDRTFTSIHTMNGCEAYDSGIYQTLHMF